MQPAAIDRLDGGLQPRLPGQQQFAAGAGGGTPVQLHQKIDPQGSRHDVVTEDQRQLVAVALPLLHHRTRLINALGGFQFEVGTERGEIVDHRIQHLPLIVHTQDQIVFVHCSSLATWFGTPRD